MRSQSKSSVSKFLRRSVDGACLCESHLRSAHLTATSRCVFSCLRYLRSASNFSSVLVILSINTSCSYCSLKRQPQQDNQDFFLNITELFVRLFINKTENAGFIQVQDDFSANHAQNNKKPVVLLTRPLPRGQRLPVFGACFRLHVLQHLPVVKSKISRAFHGLNDSPLWPKIT